MKSLNLFSLFLIITTTAFSQITTTPRTSGSWGVGRQLSEIVDSSRRDPVDSLVSRTIPVYIWYPVVKTENTSPGFPLSDEWRKEQGRYLEKKIGTPASRFIQSLQTWSVPGAAAGDVKEKFPVLLFGPGHTWLPTDYSTIIEDIVSHGYIVIGYVPTGFSGVTQLSSGKIIAGSLSVNQQEILFHDAIFVRNNLAELSGQWLNEIMNPNLIGCFGHSQGGASSVYLAGKDSTIKAVVNLDGDLMGSALKVKLTIPALLLSNDEIVGIHTATDKMDKEGRERSEYRRHSDWVRATDDNKISLRIRINGTRHLNFLDLGLIHEGILSYSERKDKLGIMNGEKSLKITSTITRMFFDTFLKNIPFPTMVKLEEEYPDIQALLWKGFPYH
jgi:hypothetical protein